MVSLPLRSLLVALVLLSGCSGGGGGSEQALTDVFVDGVPDSSGPVDDNASPVLHKVGYKEVQVGEELSVKLEAEDADGDILSFSVYGDLPPGAKFSKPEGRLVWTPAQAGGPYFVTFVVSDKKAFDSETAEFRAVTQKQDHAPVFEQIGDQVLAAGEAFKLQLQASDVDGDVLSFGVLGGMPEGAAFDEERATFEWTPGEDQAGTVSRVTFQVSDGGLTDTLEVKFVVKGGELENLPPVVEPVEQVQVAAGDELSLTLDVSDPDGDDIVVAVEPGTLPDGASFNPGSRTLTWVPPAAAQGKTFEVKFEVTDSIYNVNVSVKILVTAKPDSCIDDQFEPNNDTDSATEISDMDENLSICDTTLSPVDVDWFAIQLKPQESLKVSVNFEYSFGDLDIALFDEPDSENPIYYSPQTGGSETLDYISDSGGIYYLAVFGTGVGTYSLAYKLKTSISKTTETCAKDSFEPNNSPSAATKLSAGQVGGDAIGNLVLCPGDVDIYSVQLSCGDSIYAAITFSGQAADLDLSLVRASDGWEVDVSAGSGSSETVGADSVAGSGAYLVQVTGSSSGVSGAPYSLEVLVESAMDCVDDYLEPNNTLSEALPLVSGDELDDLTLCCDADWFELGGTSGTGKVTVNYTGSAVKARFVWGSGGSQSSVLSCASGVCSGTRALSSTPVFVAVEGAAGGSYSLKYEVQTGAGGCATAGCGNNGGGCWCDETCLDYGDCCDDACSECGIC